MRWEGHVAHMEEKRHAQKSFVGRPERKMSPRIGLPRLKYEDNIKMKLKVLEWDMLIVFMLLKIWNSGELL